MFLVKQFETKQKEAHTVKPLHPEKGACRTGLPAKQALIPQLHRTDRLIFRQMNMTSRANGIEDVTAVNGWILRYLYDNRDSEIYQRDIEHTFSVTRGTVASTLKLMEKKGYIRRESVASDARLKRIFLTEAGIETNEKLHKSFHETNELVSGLLTPEETAEMLRLLAKLQDGLGAAPAETAEK